MFVVLKKALKKVLNEKSTQKSAQQSTQKTLNGKSTQKSAQKTLRKVILLNEVLKIVFLLKKAFPKKNEGVASWGGESERRGERS